MYTVWIAIWSIAPDWSYKGISAVRCSCAINQQGVINGPRSTGHIGEKFLKAEFPHVQWVGPSSGVGCSPAQSGGQQERHVEVARASSGVRCTPTRLKRGPAWCSTNGRRAYAARERLTVYLGTYKVRGRIWRERMVASTLRRTNAAEGGRGTRLHLCTRPHHGGELLEACGA